MSKTLEHSRAFLMIPASVAHNKELLKKPKSILLLGEIVSMLNVTGVFFMNNATLSAKLDCSQRSVINYLNLLEEHHLIKRLVFKNDNGDLVSRKITAGDALAVAFSSGWTASKDNTGEIEFTTPGNTVHPPSETEFTPLVKHVSPKENIYKENNNNRNINSSANAEPPVYKDVIEYLNEKVGSRYKASSAVNKRLIDARAKEGYSLDDFKQVINNKCATWAHDPKMSKYLRPQTLFGTKFESYLNEKVPNMSPQSDFNVLKDDTIENIPDDELPF